MVLARLEGEIGASASLFWGEPKAEIEREGDTSVFPDDEVDELEDLEEPGRVLACERGMFSASLEFPFERFVWTRFFPAADFPTALSLTGTTDKLGLVTFPTAFASGVASRVVCTCQSCGLALLHSSSTLWTHASHSPCTW